MNNQPQSTVQKRVGLPEEVTPITIKRRPGIISTEVGAKNNHIGIYLDYDNAKVESGEGNEWNLSVVSVTAPIQGFTIFEGVSQTEDFNETNLNCLTFSGPRRIELVASDQIDAAPYLVFQEVVDNNSVIGWQIYAPTAFQIVDSSHLASNHWQYSVSAEPVAIKQVRFFESCNVSIEDAPPALPGALFQKVTTRAISEIDLWR